MAGHAIQGQAWPDGTLVNVYPAEAQVSGQDTAPSGSAVTNATVSAGAVTFSGLVEGRRYVAYASGTRRFFLVQPGSVDTLRPISGQEAQVLRDGIANSVRNGLAPNPINTAQVIQSAAGWDALSVPFITTPTVDSGLVTGQQLATSSGTNIFQTSSYIYNSGTRAVVALGGFAVGRLTWGENLLSAAMGNNSTAIGTEIDIGAYPGHCTCTTNGTDMLTNIVVDRFGTRFEVGAIVQSPTHVTPGTTIIAVNGPAEAPTSVQMSAAALTSGTLRSTTIVSINQTVTGILVVGEGTNIGGPGNASGTAIQVQGHSTPNLDGVNSGFGTGLRFSSTGIAAAGIPILIGGVISTNRGIHVNACDFLAGIEWTGGNYTRVLYANNVTTQHGIDFSSSTITGSAIKFAAGAVGIGVDFGTGTFSTAAIVFGAGHNMKFDTTTGTKIGTGATQKIGFWNTTPVARATGWGSPTGTATRTAFATGSVTLPALAEAVKALIDDFKTYGLLGA